MVFYNISVHMRVLLNCSFLNCLLSYNHSVPLLTLMHGYATALRKSSFSLVIASNYLSMIKKISIKIDIHPANTHDSIKLLPTIDKVGFENSKFRIGNLNADNGYQSDKNSEGLEKRDTINSMAPRKTSSRKVSKKRQNQRKYMEGIFRISFQCLGLQKIWFHGLPNVFKDTYLKFIALFFPSYRFI